MTISSRTLPRRSFVLGAAASAALMSRFTTAQESSPEASPAGIWSFTDAKGITVSLEAPPQRVVMDVNAAAPLWDFGIRPAGLFGWNVQADGSLGDAGGNIDPEGIPTAGDVNEPIKMEELIALEPDLIVTLAFTPDDLTEYWSIDAEAGLVDQVKAIAPIVSIPVYGRADENIVKVIELAGLLGADLESEELVAAKAAYEESEAALKAAAEAAPDLKALFLYIGDSESYIAAPPDWADISMYQAFGVNTYDPEIDRGLYWLTISNELALTYDVDMLFTSTRSGSIAGDELLTTPGWKEHPAAVAGQIFPWNQDFILSYQGMKAAFDVVTDALTTSTKVS
ncbi:MAG: ABC transporter substrate-binding protein [Thermomicrobiales bacterium]|nr:ABC transporter substrate-binding protein [Thermomicrobiales bacterium]